MDLRVEIPVTLAAILERLAQAEAHYQSLDKMVLVKPTGELVKLKKDNTTADFVRKFFDKFNEEYNTCTKDDKSVITPIGTRRSIGDVYRISYTYYGAKMSLVAIVCHTYMRVLESKLTENYCYNVTQTRVYKNRPSKNGNYFDPRKSDELGMTQQHYSLLLEHFKTHNHI